MARRDLEQRIASTERQLARLRDSERRHQTRQKIIVGAAVMKEADQNLAFSKWLAGRLRSLLGPKDLAQFESYLAELEGQKVEA